ncbi:MAG TPA: hypothetical protein VHJ17_14850 [Thermomonospora sp.]|nr:hypothetical protein [Thermomonospora sp.]
MKLETLLRQTLHEWADDARVPPDLADRALGHGRRRSRRTRRRFPASFAAAGATALVAASTLVVAQVTGGDVGVGRDQGPSLSQPASAQGGSVLVGGPSSTPPKRLFSAKGVVLSAYAVPRVRRGSDSTTTLERTWYLADLESGVYRRTPWAYLDVAPGLRYAAVLEAPLPSSRVGIVDMATGELTRWVQVNEGAAGLVWSPQGDRVLVTHYRGDPETGVDDVFVYPRKPSVLSTRTGYSVIDVETGEAAFHQAPPDATEPGLRQDFGWSRDGGLIWRTADSGSDKIYYEIGGGPAEAEGDALAHSQTAGVSPSGRYLAVDGGDTPGVWTRVVETATGRQVGVQPVLELVSWVDDTHLVAVDCGRPSCPGSYGFSSRYVLVDVTGREVVPLTGFLPDEEPGAWEPLFTRR